MSGSSSFVFSSLHPKIFHGRSSSSTIYPGVQAHPLVQAFETHLCAELSQLQDRGQCLSAEWLRRALDACLSIHCRVEELFPHIQQAALHQNVKWFNDHMEDTVKLLDICNALRDTTTDIRRYQASLQLAVHCLETAPTRGGQLLRARTALGKEMPKSREPSRLETCGSMLRRIGEKLVAPPPPAVAAKADFLGALHASKAVTVFVCGALVAALSLKRKRLVAPPSCATWACALNKLHGKLRDEIERKRSKGPSRSPLLRELDAADGAARGLYDLINRLINTKSIPPNDSEAQELTHSVQSLKKCLAELEDEMVPLERQVNELFRFLIAGRMALLDILSYS